MSDENAADSVHQGGATNASDGEDTKYFDIILIGTTGLGKSTLGNRLLNFEKDDNSLQSLDGPAEAEDSKPSTPSRFVRFLQQGLKNIFIGFKTGDEVEESERVESVTENCELAANKVTNVRVLDTPGFSRTLGYVCSIQTYRFFVGLYVNRHRARKANLQWYTTCKLPLYSLVYWHVDELSSSTS